MTEQTTITPDEYNKYKEFVLKHSPEDWLRIAREESNISYLKSKINLLKVYYATLESEKSISLPASTTTEAIINKFQKHFDDIDGFIKIDTFNKYKDLEYILSVYDIYRSNEKTIKEYLKSIKETPDWIKINGEYVFISLNLLCKDYISCLDSQLYTETDCLPDDIKDVYEDAKSEAEWDARRELENRIDDIKDNIEDVVDDIKDIDDDLDDPDYYDEEQELLEKREKLTDKRDELVEKLKKLEQEYKDKYQTS